MWGASPPGGETLEDLYDFETAQTRNLPRIVIV